MSWWLILALAALTYLSRVAALVFIPRLPQRATRILDRIPAALFAGLAVQSVVGPGGTVADLPVLAAAAGSLLVAPFRSLPLCLAAGLGVFGLTSLLG